MANTKFLLGRSMRWLIIAILIAIFFIAGPISLFYTAGYRYNWKFHRIEQTGVISIDAEPRDATVTLNGKVVEQSLPIWLSSVTPGTYHLEIKKSGFLPWVKDITVRSNESTYIKHIRLFEDALPINILLPQEKNLIAMTPSFDATFLALLFENHGVFEVHLHNMKTDKTSVIFHKTLSQSPSILWSPTANAVFLLSHDSLGITTQLSDAASDASSQTVFHSVTTSSIEWSDTSVFLEADGQIKKLTVSGAEDLVPSPKNGPWFIVSTEQVWEKDASSSTWAPVSGNSAVLSYIFPEDARLTRIIAINANRMIAASDHGIYVLRGQGSSAQRADLPVSQNRYNPNTKEWILWSPWELWSIYENGSAALLNRTGEAMTSVQPLDAYGVLLLLTKEGLKAFNPGYYVTQTLFRNEEIESVGINKELEKIYFLGKVGTQRGVYELKF